MRDAAMKMVAEYLEKALNFEQMAAHEKGEELKAALLAQARAYRKLAASRAMSGELDPPLSEASGDETK
jgi:hypothetical protein